MADEKRAELNPLEEQMFLTWWELNPNVDLWRKSIQKKFGVDPSPNDPTYDYRAAFLDGVEPEIVPDDDVPHWSSAYKSDMHPSRFLEGERGLVDTRTNKPLDVVSATLNRR